LPDRDFVCGFTEAVKVSLLKSPEVFDRLCRAAGRIRRREMETAWPLIQESARLHLDHITRGGDPFEMQEARPLDFGHWSAHKLEALSDFGLRHGEAVAIGVAVDTVYSSLMHGLPTADADRVLECLSQLGVPLDHPALHETDRLFAGLEEFRQHLGGRLTVTMLRAVGEKIDVHEIDRRRMLDAIECVSVHASKVAMWQSDKVTK
ncbi:MAG: 3-dehydroquinate synthase, partial [Planctomycetaceae bacterium]